MAMSGMLFLASCGSPGGDAHDGHDHASGEAENVHDHGAHGADALRASLGDNEVLITGRQMEAVGITLQHSSRQELAHPVKAFGEVVLPPAHRATLGVVMDGIVEEIRVMEGDYVRAGQLLARITHPAIADLQRDYLETAIRDTFLLRELKRQQRLRADSVNAARTLQKISADYQANLAHRRTLERKLEQLSLQPASLSIGDVSGSYPLLAPISGYVGEVSVNMGLHVTARSSLLEIADHRNAHIDLAVYEKDFGKVAPQQTVRFHVPGEPRMYWEGRVINKSRRFDPEERTARVHVSMPEAAVKDLLPGMAVTAFIGTGGQKVRALPETAFVLHEGRDYVFVLQRKALSDEPHAHEGEEHEAGKERHHDEEGGHDHSGDAGHGTEGHASVHGKTGMHNYIFRRVEVKKTVEAGMLAGFEVLREELPEESYFVVGNAQTVQSEMMRGKGGGHAHSH